MSERWVARVQYTEEKVHLQESEDVESGVSLDPADQLCCIWFVELGKIRQLR